MNSLRHQLERHGHLAVALPASAGERAGELLAGVAELLRRPSDLSALAALADEWATSATERAAVTWGSRAPGSTCGGTSHLQTVASFERYVRADRRSPALLRAVVGRLTTFGAAADRLLGRLEVSAHCTVRADVDEPDSGVSAHVDDNAVTVVFTDRPGTLLLAIGGRGELAGAAAAHGWHAVVLPGAQAGCVAAPTTTPRRSISVFAG